MRKLIPASLVTPSMVDELRMRIQADLLAEAARKGFTDMVVTDLLPFTDLNIGAAIGGTTNQDYWHSAALTANTPLVYANHALDENEFVAIYGVAIDDANPATRTLKLQRGAASILAEWNLQEIYCDPMPIGYCEEYVKWLGTDTVYVELLPEVTKAAGDKLVLVGLTAIPRGTKRLTK